MPWQISLGLGISEYYGDLGNGFFKFDLTQHDISSNGDGRSKNLPCIVTVGLNKYINSDFDFAFRAYNGEWGYFKELNKPI